MLENILKSDAVKSLAMTAAKTTVVMTIVTAVGIVGTKIYTKFYVDMIEKLVNPPEDKE